MSVWLLPRNIINLGDYNTINCIIINVQQKGKTLNLLYINLYFALIDILQHFNLVFIYLY